MNTNDFLNGLSETLAKKAKELGGQAEGFYDRQKMRGQILLERRDIDKIRQEIGDVIYRSYKSGAQLDEELKALCEEIDLHEERINNMKTDIADNKGQKICPNCESSIDKEASFCPNCGAPVPKEEKKEEAAEEICEKAADAMENICEEAAEAAGEVCEKAADAAEKAAEKVCNCVEAVKEAAEAAEDQTEE